MTNEVTSNTRHDWSKDGTEGKNGVQRSVAAEKKQLTSQTIFVSLHSGEVYVSACIVFNTIFTELCKTYFVNVGLVEMCLRCWISSALIMNCI